MVFIAASTMPAIYLPRRGDIYSYNGRTGKAAKTNIATWATRASGSSPLVAKVLSKLLPKLSELAISFRLNRLKIERDVEIPTWKYAVIDISLDWRGHPMGFDKVCDYLIDYAYAFLTSEEATKVLVLFTRV